MMDNYINIISEAGSRGGGYFRDCFKSAIDKYGSRLGVENKEFAISCVRRVQECENTATEEYKAQSERRITESIHSKTIENTDGMEGHQFEWWCADLLKQIGYSNVAVTPGSGDQGVDITAEKDDVHYAIQCKCYSSDVGNKPVQEVYAGKEMCGCQVGVVMTNRHFTAGAKQLAEKTRVLLWDRDKLYEMLETKNN